MIRRLLSRAPVRTTSMSQIRGKAIREDQLAWRFANPRQAIDLHLLQKLVDGVDCVPDSEPPSDTLHLYRAEKVGS